jgi:hypothetical protein
MTQQFGSYGGLQFQAEIIFNLTEIDGIDSVYFFDGGDHFNGGEVDRLDFWSNMSEYRKKLNKNIIEEELYNKVYGGQLLYFIDMLAERGDLRSIEKLEELLSELDKQKEYIKKTITEMETGL